MSKTKIGIICGCIGILIGILGYYWLSPKPKTTTLTQSDKVNIKGADSIQYKPDGSILALGKGLQLSSINDTKFNETTYTLPSWAVACNGTVPLTLPVQLSFQSAVLYYRVIGTVYVGAGYGNNGIIVSTLITF